MSKYEVPGVSEALLRFHTEHYAQELIGLAGDLMDSAVNPGDVTALDVFVASEERGVILNSSTGLDDSFYAWDHAFRARRVAAHISAHSDFDAELGGLS